MHSFRNDYSEGAHPRILEALVATNAEQSVGYTEDPHCARAAALILDACGLTPDEADVRFVVGGTAANVISLNGLLSRPYDAVVCTPDGHINTHETGALEACGHKVLATSDADGFVSASAVDAVVRGNAAFGHHMTRPQAIYVSDTTELGGVYTRARLEELSSYARSHGMKLYLDGARLGSALTAGSNDVDLPTVARLCDAFYLGGTKNGLLFGEAVVARDPQLRADLPWLMKRHANLLAKGRLLGVQFDALFTDDLYFKISRHAIEMAHQIRDIFVSAGYPLLFDSPTNQQYPIMPDTELAEIGKRFGYEYWERVDADHSGVRFCASWATKQEHVDALREAVNALKK